LILYLVLRLHGGAYPQYIHDKGAQLNDQESEEQECYPLYGKLLHYWFPPADGFDICPRWNIPNTRKIIQYAILYNKRPLLLLEIKPPSDFHMDAGRDVAIAQAIYRLDEVGLDNAHPERLYVISAMGKRWRACYTLKGSGSGGGQPVMAVAEADSLRSANPECWNPDVLSDASYTALQSIVETIKGYGTQ
jgi:hypothetical protein